MCLGDVLRDGTVNSFDVLVLFAQCGTCPSPCPPACQGDVNDDCQVDVMHLLQVLAPWGPCA